MALPNQHLFYYVSLNKHAAPLIYFRFAGNKISQKKRLSQPMNQSKRHSKSFKVPLSHLTGHDLPVKLRCNSPMRVG